MSFQLPLIGSYSLKYQLGILLFLFFISYLYRGARLTLACLVALYIVFLSIVPVSRWSYYLFKAIAMFGFYTHFFLTGVRFMVLGFEWAQNRWKEWQEEETKRRSNSGQSQ